MNWKKILVTILFVLPLGVVLGACTAAQVHAAAPDFTTALSLAAAAIPGIGPALSPLIASLGGLIGAATGTAGAGAVVGALVVQHRHAGLPGTKRRKLLAGVTAAHVAAKAAALKAA